MVKQTGQMLGMSSIWLLGVGAAGACTRTTLVGVVGPLNRMLAPREKLLALEVAVGARTDGARLIPPPLTVADNPVEAAAAAAATGDMATKLAGDTAGDPLYRIEAPREKLDDDCCCGCGVGGELAMPPCANNDAADADG